MNKFLKSAGVPAALLIGATVSAQAQSSTSPVQVESMDAQPARFAFTAHDTSTSKPVEFTLNKYAELSVEGYLAAAGTFTKYDNKRSNREYCSSNHYDTSLKHNDTKHSGSGREYSLFNSQAANVDAAFIGFKLANRQTGLNAYTSILWVPNGKSGDGFDEAGILDAYVSWGKTFSGGTITLTGGKYLSYFGLESFYAPAMNQISYGLQSFLPGYHTGIKVDYATRDEKLTLGLSVEDSLFSASGFNQGDGRLGGVGIEGFLSFKATQNFTLSAVIGGDTKPDSRPDSDFDFCSNFFATYTQPFRNGGSISFSGELNYLNHAYKAGSRNNEWTGWGLVAHYKQESGRAAGISALARLSARYAEDHAYAYQLTLSPGYAFNKHFLIRAELSWTTGNAAAYKAFTGDSYSASRNNYFVGIQSVLTF
jgi:hypothetical protein